MGGRRCLCTIPPKPLVGDKDRPSTISSESDGSKPSSATTPPERLVMCVMPRQRQPLPPTPSLPPLAPSLKHVWRLPRSRRRRQLKHDRRQSLWTATDKPECSADKPAIPPSPPPIVKARTREAIDTHETSPIDKLLPSFRARQNTDSESDRHNGRIEAT